MKNIKFLFLSIGFGISLLNINTVYADNNIIIVEPINIDNDEFLGSQNYEVVPGSDSIKVIGTIPAETDKQIIDKAVENIENLQENTGPDNKQKNDIPTDKIGPGFSLNKNNFTTQELKVKNPLDSKLPGTVFLRKNAVKNRRNILLVLDPGHGPSVKSSYGDWTTADYYGVRGMRFGGQTEEEFTFKVAKYMEAKLLDAGFDIINTRKDIYAVVPNKLRGLLATETKADHTIYIHWNAGGGRGPLRYLPKDFDLKPWKNQANGMWSKISNRLKTYFGVDKTVDIKGELSVFLTNNTPQTYIEVGFADNEKDLAKMAGDINNKNVADVIVEGILDYYGR